MKANIYLLIFLCCFMAKGQTDTQKSVPTPILKLDFDDDKDSDAVKSILRIKNIEIAEGTVNKKYWR